MIALRGVVKTVYAQIKEHTLRNRFEPTTFKPATMKDLEAAENTLKSYKKTHLDPAITEVNAALEQLRIAYVQAGILNDDESLLDTQELSAIPTDDESETPAQNSDDTDTIARFAKLKEVHMHNKSAHTKEAKAVNYQESEKIDFKGSTPRA